MRLDMLYPFDCTRRAFKPYVSLVLLYYPCSALQELDALKLAMTIIWIFPTASAYLLCLERLHHRLSTVPVLVELNQQRLSLQYSEQ